MNKRIVVAAVGVAALLSTASPVFAQAKQEVYGPVLPMQYDGNGGRHWMEYGYSGPWLPPLVWEKGLVKASYAGFWVTRLIRRRGEPAFQ